MIKLFGTDGVRGVANSELTAQLAYSLGHSGARVLAGRSGHKPKFLIGRDTRISCDMLEAAIIAGICSTGADAISAGVIPTPAVAYLTSLYGADAGVVISASHNSFEFNGIKFFNNSGYKLHDSIEAEIEELIARTGKDPADGTTGDASPESAGPADAGSGDEGFGRTGGANARMLPSDTLYEPPVGGDVGRHSLIFDAKDNYVRRLVSTAGSDLNGVRIALDCANGAASHIAPDLFGKLGAQVCAIHCKPDGLNINDKCGSTHLDAIRAYVAECGADIGFAFDGDADRVIAVDERGGVIDGDAMMALLAIDMKGRGALAKDTVAATVMSNIGLEIAIKRHGIKLVRTAVGDRYVLEEMLKNGYILGGENSGHIICLDDNTTGDGMFAALRLLKALFGGGRAAGKPVSELTGVVKAVPQIILNAKVSNAKKNMYLEDPVIRERCQDIESLFSGEGRVLIRPSGTEPLVRVMIESNDRSLMETEAEGLVKLIEARLG